MNYPSRLIHWGVLVDRDKLKAAYFSTRVVSQKEHEATVKLLQIFAQHLSLTDPSCALPST